MVTFVCTGDNIVVSLITLVNCFAMFILPSSVVGVVFICTEQGISLDLIVFLLGFFDSV